MNRVSKIAISTYNQPLIMNRANHMRAVGLLLLTLIVGCGQKGPLYLPEEKPTAASENSSELESQSPSSSLQEVQ